MGGRLCGGRRGFRAAKKFRGVKIGKTRRQTSGGGARSKARLMWGCSRRHPERQLPADMPDEVQSQWREWTAHYRRPHRLGTRQSAVAVEAGCACHAVLWQLLQGKWRCRAHIAAALVLMRATRLSPGRTQAAAEPTARPTAAAASTDSTTKMVASASVASVRMRGRFADVRSASDLMRGTNRVRRVHQMQ